jgi:hypothetical protein
MLKNGFLSILMIKTIGFLIVGVFRENNRESIMKITAKAIITMTIAFVMAMPLCASAPMSNEDVIKLVKAGVSEALVLSSIDSSETQFDTSADALIKLKQAGISDMIIQRMLTKKTGLVIQPVISDKGATCKLATSENLQAIMDGNKQVNLGYRQADIDEDVSAGSTIASFFTLGIAPEKGTVSARISGNRAINRIKSRTPTFLDLATIEGQLPDDVFALVKLEVKGDDRILIIGESSASVFGGYKVQRRRANPLKA